MNRERFIRQRRNDWQQFETLLTGMKNRRLSRWSGHDITRLSGLYRSVCYDLSLVQSREWGARLEQYLNDLVAQGHNCLYRSPPRSLDTALKFLSQGFPQLLRARRHFFFVSLALFVVPFVISMVIAAIDPVMAERIIDRTHMEQAGENYSGDLYQNIDAKFAEERSFMTGFYVWNNVGIAFRCFALGVFFGVGTVITLLFNGIMLGAVTGYIINQGFADNFFSFAISHGSFELTAIVISGAAGLLLGWGMIHPGELSRRESLRVHGIDAIKLASGAGFMLVIAALIEGYFSPMALPHSVKYVVGTMLWALVFVYLVHGGRETTDAGTTIDSHRRRFSTAHSAENAE
ncbi:MAG: stage II sporulation protein M [Fuerstiella sp.]|nr:stage II sporulation protein M [Fuerstiella sp.]